MSERITRRGFLRIIIPAGAAILTADTALAQDPTPAPPLDLMPKTPAHIMPPLDLGDNSLRRDEQLLLKLNEVRRVVGLPLVYPDENGVLQPFIARSGLKKTGLV